MRQLALVVAITSVPTAVFAQSCADVYREAVQNVEISTLKRSEASFYFNLYCQESGETRDLQTSASFSVPIKGIPLDFSGDGDWSQEEWTNFCRTGAEQGYYNMSEASFGSYTVPGALSSFNECVAIEKNKLLITHDLTPPFGVAISGILQSPDPVRILGMLYQEDLVECTSNSFSSDGSEQTIGLGQAINNITDDFVLNCVRKGQENDGSVFYPSTAITLGTSEGNYTVRLSNDQLLNFDLASQSRAAYDAALAARNAAQDAQAAAEANAASLSSRMANPQISIHTFGTGEYDKTFLSPRHDPRWGPSPEERADSLCGGKHHKLFVVSDRAGDCCGYTEYVAVCVAN